MLDRYLNSHNRVLRLFSCRRFLRDHGRDQRAHGRGQQHLAVGRENRGWSFGAAAPLLCIPVFFFEPQELL
jgi:hypothetical protein